MGITVATTDLPIATYCAWQAAIDKASDEGIPFHPAWKADFWTFLADNGPCPDGSRFTCESHILGYVPDYASWHGVHGRYKPSYDECPIAVMYLNSGVLNEQTALRLASIDADIHLVRHDFANLDIETRDKTAPFRREAFAAMVDSLEDYHGSVPSGEPNRWQIAQLSAEIKQEYVDSKQEPDVDVDDDEFGDFEDDPRNSMVLNLSRVGLAKHRLR